MATFVGMNGNGGAGGTYGATTGIAVQVGDVVAVFAKWEVNSGAITNVADTNGVCSSYSAATTQQNHTNGDLFVQAFYGIVVNVAALIVNVSFNALANFSRIHVIVFRPGSGPGFSLGTGDAAPVRGANNGSDNDLTTVTSLTPSARGAAATFFGEYASVTYTPGTDWVEPTNAETAGAYTEYQLIASAGTPITGTATASGSMQYLAHMVFFADDTPPVPPAAPTLYVTRSGIRLR